MKLLGRIGAAVVVLYLAVASTSAAPEPKNSRPRYGFPELRAGQFWVSSVPVGLEVYAGTKPKGKPLGRTPLRLSSRQVGSHLTVSVLKSEYSGTLPHQFDLVEPSAENTQSTTIKYPDREEDWSRAITYKVDPSRKPTLIALFQAKSGSLSDWSRHYPPGVNLRFRDEAAKVDLTARGVPPAFLPEAIRLLHRGGKIALPGRDGWFVAEITLSGRVAVVTAPTPGRVD